MPETTFQRVFRAIVAQEDFTVPENGVGPETLLKECGSKKQKKFYSGLVAALEENFRWDEYFFEITNVDFAQARTVNGLAEVVNYCLQRAKEKRLAASTFDRVRRIACRVAASIGWEYDPEKIKPDTTLDDLDLEWGPVGAMGFFDALEEDFKTDHTGFRIGNDWFGIKTIQGAVDLVDQKLGKVPAGR